MCKKECGDWPEVPRKDAGRQTSTEFSQGLGWWWELLTSVGGEEQEFQAGVLHLGHGCLWFCGGEEGK